MGGYTRPRCKTVIWRNGIRVCEHSVAKLNAWAKSLGPDIYCKPIQGCYSGSVNASKGTHDGGGVYDIEMDGYTATQGNFSVNKGRKVLLATFGRWWNGNHHIHLIDPDCPDLAPEAEDQMEQFRRGETGLVGYDRDIWDRSTATAIMRAYDSRHDVKAPATGTARTYRIPKGGTLGKAAVALGVSVGLLASFNGIKDPNVVRPGQVVTAPPADYKAPKPATKPVAKPAPKPKPKPVAKPKPKPVVKKKPVVKPKAKANTVNRKDLYVGKHGTSVLTYEKALRAYIGTKKANTVGLTATRAADRYYGTATAAATKIAYRQLGVTPNATSPGPYLLRVLGLKG